MSIKHIDQARVVRTGKSSKKLLLLALAYFTHPDTHWCCPSIGLLCEFTELNRKTVIASLEELKSQELIRPINQELGISNRIIVYHFMPQQFKKSEKVG